MISFICSFEIINAVVREAKSEGQPDPNIFLRIASSVADTAAVNPNGNKRISSNDFNIFLIKGKPVFSNGRRSLPKNPPDCSILCD